MSDHEFEKKVAQTMGELKLRPSDAVWAEVESKLRREKRRRRIILWLPLMGVLLTAGGYFIFKGPGDSEKDNLAKALPSQQDVPGVSATPSAPAQAEQGANAASELKRVQEPALSNASSPKTIDYPTSQNSTPVNNKANRQNEISPDQPVSDQPDRIVTPAPATDKSAAQPANISPNNTREEKLRSQRELAPPKQQTVTGRKKEIDAAINSEKPVVKSPEKTLDKKQSRVSDETAKVSEEIADNKTDEANPVNAEAKVADNKQAPIEVKNITPEKPADSNAVAQKATVDSASKDGKPTEKKVDSTARKPAPAIVKAPKKRKSEAGKWQWGVTANGGMANISEGGLMDVLRTVRVDDLANAGPPTYFGIPPMPTPEPSPIDPGVKFSVGGFVQRELTKRFSLSAGLQYSYFSMNTQVGSRVNASISVNYGNFNSQQAQSYYRADNFGPMQDYLIRYHFAELPVSASYLLVKSKKLPVTVDAGFSLSRLLNTNGIHYDGITKVYFENDDFYNKTQVSLNGGLNLGLLQKSKHPLWVGPTLRYFATALIKSEVTTSDKAQHIWSFGINAKMLLKK
jgi:hypothetical protein